MELGVALPHTGAHARLTEAAPGWEGVTAQPHRFGGTEYRFGEKREMGHVHGDRLLDIPFPTKIRDELVAARRAEPHLLLSGSGWSSCYLRAPEDVERAVDLLRLSYEITAKRKAR
jgi:hypothetical protein